MQEVIGSTPIFSTQAHKGAESEQNSLLSPLVSAKTQTQLPIDLINAINAIGMSKNYTEPYLSKGKAVTSVPKGSTKVKEQAKADWFINFSFLNPNTGKMQRFRMRHDGNRIKEPDKKLEYFTGLLKNYKALLEAGWNPIDEISNAELRRSIISLTLGEGRDLYKVYHENKGTRKKSIQTYMSKVNAFIDFHGERKAVKDITEYEIMTFLNHNEATLGWLGTTYVNAKIALNGFFKFLKVNKHIPLNPVTDVETRKKIRTELHEVFSDDDFKLILEWLEQHDAYALLFCKAIYYTCIRPKELRYLQLKHIDLKEAKITVPASISKNKLAQPIFIDESFMRELKMLNLGNYDKDYYLFGSTTNIVGPKHIGENTPYNRFRKCLIDLKLDKKNYSMYSFKHLSNVNKRKAGWEYEEISRANRHSSVIQVETYLKHLQKYVKNDKAIPPI